MELLKSVQFRGISFDIIQEVMKNGNLYLIMRMINHNDKKKRLSLEMNYISKSHGLMKCYTHTLGFGYSSGSFLQPNSFVDLEIRLDSDNIRYTEDGDRIEFEVNEGKVASLLLLKQDSLWFIAENNEKFNGLDLSHLNKELKERIEHFEGIEEKFGLMLQNFSVRVLNENTIKLFCEVLALNGDVSEEGFNVEVAIYDNENNIHCLKSISKYEGDFQGFEVFGFGEITLDIPVVEIGKIRFYPTR